ncbi:Hpt domain-containing protein [Rugamonas apoptosis]|uniref:Hpt domain-containing protein n=1 Tax=Rugamonas apoptosis TaxID=2758570 RepID=A0A7W2F9U5_9BURK|nr:Hpt domain-containing protein [Rugamonas apoptosis]MBA5687788.1 Hpt domain-containing protein [Rugamonas apoptosis]
MATVTDQEFRARMQALCDKFAATVPVTLDKITRALAACRADGPDGPDAAHLHELHELLHGVAGTAGTFGYGTLGQYCRNVEQQMRAVLAGQAEWPAVADQVDALLRWAARDPRAPSW